MKNPALLPDIRKREKLPPDLPFSRWTITVRLEPVYGRRNTTAYSERKTCGACGSQDTTCIYSTSSAGREPSSIAELLCPKCQCFTVYVWEGY
jgi:hypothetical protein